MLLRSTLVVASACAAAAAAPAPAAAEPLPAYKNAALPVPARVADLVARMNQDELIAAVAHKDGDTDADLRAKYGATGIGGVKVTLFSTPPATALEAVRARNAFQSFFIANSRLNIPVSIAHEGLHSGSFYGTVFPEPLLTACSWNDSLPLAIGAVLGAEARAYGVDNAWSPVVNMWSDDRFGRYQEGFSPDPTITSHMGRAIVLGMQGGASASDDYLPGGFNSSAWATAKHFVGYGSAQGGLNGGPFALNNRTLFEHYLRPWRAMAAVGVRGVMPSHNAVLDVPMHLNKWAIESVLRNEFGFDSGMTVSDCNDIGASFFFGVASNLTQVTARAIKAGLDVDLQCGPDPRTLSYLQWIPDALDAGLVTLDDLRKLAGRYLTQKFAAGLFDSPLTDEAWLSRLDAPAHRQLAYEAAAQSIVLLQNSNGALPLAFGTAVKRVALIGPMMTDASGGRDNMLGSYTLDNGVIEVDLLPAAFNKTFGAALAVTVEVGASPDNLSEAGIAAAVAAAQNADVAIVAVGDSLKTCGEWLDRDSLDLPGAQLALLQALVANASSTPIVLVLVNGRAASFGPANALLGGMAAVVEAWRPGEMGAQAIVDILSGKVNPSGKLASQWAQNVGQMGSGAQPWLQRRVAKWVANTRSAADLDGREYDPYVATAFSSLPLFRFGHGLSYTTYVYKSITVDGVAPVSGLPGGGTFSGRGGQGYRDALAAVVLTAHVNLCNTGARDGAEVVQLYARLAPQDLFPGGLPIVPHWKRLVGYGRAVLAAGACATLDLPVIADDLALYDDAMVLRVVPADYVFSAGGRSDLDVLVANVTLVA
jgi:beta-glucosidase